MANNRVAQALAALAQRKAGRNVCRINIRSLSKVEDLKTWREDLIRVLEIFDLAKYIESDVREPEDFNARLQFFIDRRYAEDYIRATVSDQKVWNALRKLGWSHEDKNPKKTFDFVVQYFEQLEDRTKNANIPVNTAVGPAPEELSAITTGLKGVEQAVEDQGIKLDSIVSATTNGLKGVEQAVQGLGIKLDRIAQLLERQEADWSDIGANVPNEVRDSNGDLVTCNFIDWPMDDVSISGLEQAVRNLIIKLDTLKEQLVERAAPDESDSQAVEEFKGVNMELDRVVQQLLEILRADRHQRLGGKAAVMSSTWLSSWTSR
ncbi:hypothetical protein N656DRAFT_849271 [Canariomyces notabilis]|uniref:Uncharacterized protein n=1 Tax=Canariomyces notabilis TaxID=2074819 RepID=A0AAN6QCC1_9PEZI|nr:hypothetical protein N656DRAFT_849271 [Canariomyces arenarius]